MASERSLPRRVQNEADNEVYKWLRRISNSVLGIFKLYSDLELISSWEHSVFVAKSRNSFAISAEQERFCEKNRLTRESYSSATSLIRDSARLGRFESVE